jgi:hypothetical protein
MGISFQPCVARPANEVPERWVVEPQPERRRPARRRND